MDSISTTPSKSILLSGSELFAVEKYYGPHQSHIYADITIVSKVSDKSRQEIRRFNGAADHARVPKIGVGIYGCYLDDQLFYLGIYSGSVNTSGGSVITERWQKHIGGMTLRAHNVSLSRKALNLIPKEGKSALNEALLSSEIDLTKDRGLMATINKVRFANRHWELFSNLDNTTLRRFSFSYNQYDSSAFFNAHEKRKIKDPLKRVESDLVKQLRPLCNTATRDSNGYCTASINTTKDAIENAFCKFADRACQT